MLRTTTLTAICTALAATIVVPAPILVPAGAAAATCRGEAATLVGSGYTLVGTEGRDVVVTNRSQDVKTLGGNDLICITGPDQGAGSYRPVTLDAGSGDDIVDGTAADSWPVDAQLGTGADRFEGGAGGDRIQAGSVTGWPSVTQDGDSDVVITGGGADSVTSGTAGQPNADVVDLGAGDDSVSWRSSRWVSGAAIDGGDSGSWGDSIALVLPPGDSTLDTTPADGSGELRGAAALARWSGMERHYLSDGAAGAASVTLAGGGAEDRISVSGAVPVLAALGAGDDSLYLARALPGDARVEADLGVGDDLVAVSRVLPAGSRLVAGPGRDGLTMGSEEHALSWDLAGDGIAVGSAWTIGTNGFEDATLMAPRVELWGTGGSNSLAFVSCDGRLRGRAGGDTLRVTWDLTFELYKSCNERSVMVGGAGSDRLHSRGRTADRMTGGAGDDRFEARSGRDTVLGGPGRDTAEVGNGADRFLGGPGVDRVDGGAGRDTCRAERVKRCERT